MSEDEKYMLRCVQLAKLGEGNVLPNPMVGAVVVYNNKIIGEGYHQQFGAHHAEVNCINSIKDNEKHLIKDATLYVSLEPCTHYGKTPPCTALILEKNIKKVVIGCNDSNVLVDGLGIKFLQDNGVEVVSNILHKECKKLNEVFFYNQKYKLPFITLKWAQSKNDCIGNYNSTPIKISNEYTNRFVHQLRNKIQAIMVGSNTIEHDNPQLNNRFYGANQPIIIIVDRQLRLNRRYQVFNKKNKILIFNQIKSGAESNIIFIKSEYNEQFLENCFKQVYTLNIASILVEGGAILHNLLIEKQLYNKIVKITNDELILQNGLTAPNIVSLQPNSSFTINKDIIESYNLN